MRECNVFAPTSPPDRNIEKPFVRLQEIAASLAA